MDKVTIGSIFGATFALLGRNTALIAAFVVAVSAISVTVNWALGATFGGIVGGIASFVITYLLLHRLLLDEGVAEVGPSVAGGFAFFGASLLAGIGAILGFVLLIVPGLILWARWSIVNVLVVGKGMPVSEAFSESWHMTKPGQWPIVGFFLIVIVISVAASQGISGSAIFSAVAAGQEPVISPLSLTGIAMELVSNCMNAFVVGACIAIYSQLCGNNPIDDIFG